MSLDRTFKAGNRFVRLVRSAMANADAVNHQVVIRVLPPEVFKQRLAAADVSLLDEDQRLVTAVLHVGENVGGECLALQLLLALICLRGLVMTAAVARGAARVGTTLRADALA